MRSKRYVATFLLVSCILIVQSAFELSATPTLIVLAVSFVLLWEYYDRKDQFLARIENKELQERIQSTTKDAHLKNKQLLTIVGSIPYPLLLLDQFGNIVMSNNTKEISKDAPFEEMTYMQNNLVEPVQDFIKDSFIMEKDTDKILRIQGIEYQSISVPITAKEQYRGCLFLFQDVSKTLEGEKMQKRFIADASHELKTPISIIKGMVEILNRDHFNDEKTREEFLQQIEVEINRLDILVKDLLQLSRLSLSNVILKKEKVDLCAVIDKSIKSLEKTALRKHLTIAKDYQYQGLVHCDEMKMSQVMINLISNAIKYSEQGTIIIQTQREKNYCVIHVKDQGRGIAPEDKEKIFERFYRIDDDRSRKNGGSGLGLPIVKSTIEAHGGKIEVTSNLNQGSTFSIRILI